MEIERFQEGDVARNYVCKICHAVSMEPVKHQPCEAIYCNECICKDSKFRCLNCPEDSNPQERTNELNRLEKNIYEDLHVSCLFCKRKDITLSTYLEHPKTCMSWPSELSIISGSTKIPIEVTILSSEPFTQRGPMRPYRMIDFFQNGKKIRRNTHKTAGYVRDESTVARIIQQAAIATNKPAREIALVHTTHRVLRPSQVVKSVLNNTYSTLTIVDREIARKIEGKTISVGLNTKEIEDMRITETNDEPNDMNPVNHGPDLDWGRSQGETMSEEW